MTVQNTKPYVTVATVCERVMEEKDGVISVIRFIDRVNFGYIHMSTGQAAEVDATVAATAAVAVFDVALLVGLKAGALRGRSTLSIVMERPDGTTITSLDRFPIEFSDQREGVNVHAIFRMPPQATSGRYWFVVLWNGEELTRFPLTLSEQVAPAPSATTTASVEHRDA